MLFNSYVFWVFFVIVAALYFSLRHRAQNHMLLIASYVFYGWWDWRFLSLIAFCTLVNFVAAWWIHRQKERWRHYLGLAISCGISLGLLGVFKYYNFFSESLAELCLAVGLPIPLPLVHIALPVGISFFTFQAMSYTIDVHRGRTTPTGSFLDFALYVSFFPQLVAGPIERSDRLLPQVLDAERTRHVDFRVGLYHVLMGLFKKVVIADNLAAVANTIFDTPTAELTGTEALIGVYAFAFQIYGDFSGYSSIAQGVAKWLGFDLMDNFRMPYFARTPSEFWRRWHISLSTWLRDYLYIGLGGNRHGERKTYRNLMITMILGGLWHGAAWTFVAWGVFHGLILCLYRPFENRYPGSWRGRPILSLLMGVFMFHLVCISWLLFRASTFEQAWNMFILMLTQQQVTSFAVSGLAMILFFAGPLMVYEYWVYRHDHLLRLLDSPWYLRALFYTYLVLMMFFFLPPQANAFIYFRF